MSEKKYIIDACSLIEAAHSYNMKKKSFSYIWDKFGSEIDKGNLLSSIEIFYELKDKDLANWAQRYKHAFVPLTKEIQVKTTEVLDEYPALIKMRSHKNSNGDPFLIATAIVYDGVVVTNEGTKSNGIPAVCQGLGIEYMNLRQYLDEILD